MQSGNLTINISDHLPSCLIMPKNNQRHIPKKQDFDVRDWKGFDRVNFTPHYLNIDWRDKLARYNDDANKAFHFLLENT